MAAPLYVSRNGALISPADAAISVFNPAIYGAYGVYESMQVRNGIVFEQAAHLARLAHSAEIISLPLPAEPAVIGRWIAEVLAANQMAGCAECTLRLFVVGPENGGFPLVMNNFNGERLMMAAGSMAFVRRCNSRRTVCARLHPKSFGVECAPVVAGYQQLPLRIDKLSDRWDRSKCRVTRRRGEQKLQYAGRKAGPSSVAVLLDWVVHRRPLIDGALRQSPYRL